MLIAAPVASEPLDRRDHALQLVAFPHRCRAGPGAFAADIDQRRPRLEHCGGMGIGDLGIVHELAAIGKTVGRDIENAHHLRLIEPDRARAELQRGMGCAGGLSHCARAASGKIRQRARLQFGDRKRVGAETTLPSSRAISAKRLA